MPRTEKGRTQVRDGGILVIIRLQSGRLIDAPTRRSESGQAHVQRVEEFIAVWSFLTLHSSLGLTGVALERSVHAGALGWPLFDPITLD